MTNMLQLYKVADAQLLFRNIALFPVKAAEAVAKPISDFGSRLYNYAQLQGAPYKNTFNLLKAKKLGRVNILFTGAADSGHLSYIDQLLKHVPGSYRIFRHGDIDQARQFVAGLPKQLKNKLHITGHSWGSKPALQLGNENRTSNVYLVDPVGRSLPVPRTKNITHYAPTYKAVLAEPDARTKAVWGDPIGARWNNLVATIGGRKSAALLNVPIRNRKVYSGDHLNGTEYVVKSILEAQDTKPTASLAANNMPTHAIQRPSDKVLGYMYKYPIPRMNSGFVNKTN